MNDLDLKYSLSLSLLRKLCDQQKNENFVFSPSGLGAALAMLTAGLKGETKAELLNLFGTSDENAVHNFYGSLVANDSSPLKMANKYLADQDLEVQRDFGALLRVSSIRIMELWLQSGRGRLLSFLDCCSLIVLVIRH